MKNDASISLRKLSRLELMSIMVEQENKIEELNNIIVKLKKELADKDKNIDSNNYQISQLISINGSLVEQIKHLLIIRG